jgi:uncharacterized protein YraI
MRIRLACVVAATLSIASGAATAQTEAYTDSPVDVYAGPAQDYPLVAQWPAGQPVIVYGCVDGYSWCDVEVQGARGWVYGGYLSYPYQGSEVPIMTYGTVIGLPLITFSPGTYWDQYYRERPWYHDRDRWAHHPPPPYRPPPPGNPPHPQGATRPPPPPSAQPPGPPGREHGHRTGPPQGGTPPMQPPAQGYQRPSGPPPQAVQRPPGPPPVQGDARPPASPPAPRSPPPSAEHHDQGTSH